MDAVERVAPAAREELGDGLVGEDHQLLDQGVGLRLRLEPRALHAALAVEREVDLAALDPERTAVEAASAQLGRDAVGQAERLGKLGLGFLAGEDRFGLRVA